MIALITCNSSLVPLLEGLYSSNPYRFEFSFFWVLGTCCWREKFFLTWGKIEGLFVFSLFFDGGRSILWVYGGVYVWLRTQAYTLHVGYLNESPGVGTRHLEGPKNPDGLNLGTYVFAYVYKVHMYLCVLGGRMRSWTNWLFFLDIFLKKSKRCERNTVTKNLNPIQ